MARNSAFRSGAPVLIHWQRDVQQQVQRPLWWPCDSCPRLCRGRSSPEQSVPQCCLGGHTSKTWLEAALSLFVSQPFLLQPGFSQLYFDWNSGRPSWRITAECLRWIRKFKLKVWNHLQETQLLKIKLCCTLQHLLEWQELINPADRKCSRLQRLSLWSQTAGCSLMSFQLAIVSRQTGQRKGTKSKKRLSEIKIKVLRSSLREQCPMPGQVIHAIARPGG
jgi:hypothetical protein